MQWRNVRESVGALFVILFFAWEFSRTSQLLVRAGFGLLIAGSCYVECGIC